MDRWLLLLSTLAFLGGFIHDLIALKKGQWQTHRWRWLPMLLGLGFQTAFLYLRGQLHGRCPITSLVEVLIFIGWGIAWLYFIVGNVYRLSLLGLFTAPLVALMQVIGLCFLTSDPHRAKVSNAWLELHASVSLIAYAAFALACVTGIMYLIQERLLKQHRIHSLFFQLPPIHELARVIGRLCLVGLVLLSLGLAASWPLNLPISNPKLIVAWTVWSVYLIIQVVILRHMLSARYTAWLAVLGFVVPLVSLWLVTKA
jgi:HemX protein